MRVNVRGVEALNTTSFKMAWFRTACVSCLIIIQICLSSAFGQDQQEPSSGRPQSTPLPEVCLEVLLRPLSGRFKPKECSGNGRLTLGENNAEWQRNYLKLGRCQEALALAGAQTFVWSYDAGSGDTDSSNDESADRGPRDQMKSDRNDEGGSSSRAGDKGGQEASIEWFLAWAIVDGSMRGCANLMLDNNYFPGNARPELTNDCTVSNSRVDQVSAAVEGYHFGEELSKCQAGVVLIQEAVQENKCCDEPKKKVEEMKVHWFQQLVELNKLLFFSRCRSFEWKGIKRDAIDLREALISFYQQCEASEGQWLTRCDASNCETSSGPDSVVGESKKNAQAGGLYLDAMSVRQ